MTHPPAHPRRRRPAVALLAILVAAGIGAVCATGEMPPPPASPPATPPAPAAAAPSPIDALNQAALQETFRLLRTNYIQREALTLEELNRAALDGLLARLDFGAELVPLGDASAAPDAPVPVVIAEPLGEAVAYLRPVTFSLETVPHFDAALGTLNATPETTLILDLRTPAPTADFAVAAGFLDRFVPAGQPLFSVQKPDDPAPRHFRSGEAPKWPGKLIVLIDDECTSAAETMAAVLRGALQAPLLGAATRGRTMQYETAPISATHALRFASAEMRLPDGTSLFRKGLTPDLEVASLPDAKAAVFDRQAQDGVRRFIVDPERPRHNEAALVAKSAPELAFQIAHSTGTPTPYDSPPLRDRPLQVAVDLLAARRAL